MRLAQVVARALVVAGAAGVAGCAALLPPAPGTPSSPPAGPAAAGPAASAASAPPARNPGVRVAIEAPSELKALLERNLDVVRLGRLEREEVDGTEWVRLADAAPAQARELLQTEGYFSPTVSVEADEAQANAVRLKVAPGARGRVARVTLQVDGDLEREAEAGDARAAALLAQWRAGFALKEGSDFRNPAWSEAKANALAALRAAGYASASWSGTNAQVDTQANSVTLFLVADSGPLFRYGSMQIEGLVVHDQETVGHLIAAPRGAPLTETLLLDFQERLQKSGLFQSANVSLDTTDAANAAESRVLVRLREAPLQVTTFGVGVSANTGPRATAEHTARRVFGYPISSRNKVELGLKRQYWQGEISTHPNDRLYRTLIGGTVENLKSDTDTVLSQRLRLGRTQDTQRLERLYFVEAERSRKIKVNQDRSSADALSLNYHSVWRDLDSVVLPTQGFTLAGQLGVGHSRGSDASPGLFTRAYARVTGYLPVGRVWYGQARVELGQVFLGANNVVPESQKWRAGGDDSVRGYGYRNLGPLDSDGLVTGGTSLYTASLEVARPVLRSIPALWGAVFVDTGNAANSFGNIKPVVGYGFGARWRSPVGPLRLDLAWAAETRKARLHFSVGIAF